jgi:hypothetical protein
MMMTLSLVVRRGVGALVTKSILGDQHNLQIKHSINSMATRTSITREICMHMRVKQDKKITNTIIWLYSICMMPWSKC